MSKGCFCALAIVLLVVSCSPKPDVPSVNSPITPVNVAACKTASLNLRHLDAPGVRGLVNCLNGDNSALGPYKTFFDQMDTGELNQLLEVYNRYVAGSGNRLNQTMDLLDRMHKKGVLASAMKDIQVLTDTQTAQKALPILSRFFESDRNPGKLDPNLKGLNRYIVKLIDNKLMSPNIIGAANITSGLRARALAILFSLDTPASVMNSDKIVDLLATEGLRSFDDNALHMALSHMSEPRVSLVNTLRNLTDHEIFSLADFLSFLPQGSTSGGTRINRLRLAVKGADAPLTCYKNGRSARVASNLLEVIGKEALKRAEGAPTDQFFLQVVPLLLMTTKDACDYSNDIINNIEIDKEIARLGYGSGHRAFFHLLLSGSRFKETISVVESPYLPRLAPLLEEMALRGSVPFALEDFSKDQTPVDAQALAAALDLLVDGELRDAALGAWLNKNINGPQKAVLLNAFNSLPSGNKTLFGLSQLVQRDPKLDEALRALKDATALQTFADSDELIFENFAKKFLKNDPQPRQELKDFAKALVKSLADRRGGLGDLIGVGAQATGMATETPVQDIVHDVLSDQNLMDAINPILWKLTRDQNFINSVAFTGTLAGNGNLEKVLEFLVDLFRNSAVTGMTTGPMANSYQKPTADAVVLAQSAKPFHPHGVNPTYDDCLTLRGSLFDFGGENLYAALKCMADDPTYPVLGVLGDQLRAANQLGDASEVLRQIFVKSPYITGALNELETLSNTGELGKILRLFALMGDKAYGIPYMLDRVLNDAFRHKGMPGLLKLTGKVASLGSISTAGQAAIDVLETPAKKIFHSDSSYRLKISPAQEVALKKQIKGLFEGWTDQQVDAAYKVAAENFVTHNDAWRYDEGPYRKLDNAQWKNELATFFSDLLRTTDIEELVAALQDVAANMAPAKFLQRAIRDRRAAIHYTDDGQKKLHILTLWEQLEELTEDANFDLPLAGHVGVTFQLAVAKSTDLPSTMDTQHTLSEAGEVYSTIIGKHVEAHHFKSMLSNYSCLTETAKTGELKVFQRIYQALYRATPDAHKDDKNAKTNHMSTVFHVNHMAMFANLTMGLSNADEQGYLETIVNGLMGMTLLIQPKDVAALRLALTALLTQIKNGNTTPLDVFLDKLLTVQQNPQGYQELKDTLFHLVPAYSRLNLEPTGIIKAIPYVVTQPLTWNDAVDKFFGDASSPNGNLFTIGANLLNIDDNSVNAFRQIGSVALMDDPQTGENYLPSVAALFGDGYAVKPADYSKVWQTFKSYQVDPRVTSLQPAVLFRNVFGELKGQSGVGDLTSGLVLDDIQRQRIIKLGYTFSKNGDVASLSQIMVNLINNGGLDAALHFIFDNLTPSSLTSSLGQPSQKTNHK